jgi:hypothetical protein
MGLTRKQRFPRSLSYNYRKGCPSGYHKRSSYKTSTGQYVPARCVRATTPYAQSSAELKRSVTRKAANRLRRRGVTPTTVNTRKVCPPGQILRQAYVRRYGSAVKKEGYTVERDGLKYKVYPTSKSMLVKAACVKDVGKPGKGEQKIGPLRKGELKKFGYVYRLPASERRAALAKAVKAYGALSTYRKLDAVAKLTLRTAPEASKIFKEDRDYVRKTYGPLKAF